MDATKLQEYLQRVVSNIAKLNPSILLTSDEIQDRIDECMDDINSCPPVSQWKVESIQLQDQSMLKTGCRAYLYMYISDMFAAEPQIQGLQGPFASTRDLQQRFAQQGKTLYEQFVKQRNKFKTGQLEPPHVTVDTYYPGGRVPNRYNSPYTMRRWW